VAYGDEMADRIRQAASKVDAFIDTFGAGYVQLALQLGVEPSRIDTIVNFEAAARYGVNADGNAAAATASVLAELAGLIATGELELPIAATRSTGSRTPTGDSRRATFSARSSSCRRRRRERAGADARPGSV
jgi:hypothetical protein